MFVYLFFLMLGSYVHANSHHPQDFLAQISGSKNEGAQIYQHFCSSCHAQKPLIPLGAPRISNENDWTKRLEQDSAVLWQHTEEGINAMPPRGGCFECSDEQLIEALLFMLPEQEKKRVSIDLGEYKKSIK